MRSASSLGCSSRRSPATSSSWPPANSISTWTSKCRRTTSPSAARVRTRRSCRSRTSTWDPRESRRRATTSSSKTSPSRIRGATPSRSWGRRTSPSATCGPNGPASRRPPTARTASIPSQCENVLIDGCIVRGAADAGVYVGQSRHIVVKNCRVYRERGRHRDRKLVRRRRLRQLRDQ